MIRCHTAVVLTLLSAAGAHAQEPAPAASPPPGFTWDSVKALARERAAAEFKERPDMLPPFWKNLDFGQHRKITARRGGGLWAGAGRGFELEFFHPGWVFPKTLTFSQVANEQAIPVEWNPEFFDYRDLAPPPETPPPDGYAGYRILAPVNGPDQMDELAVFLGASYFRALAPGLTYGTSARAMTVNPARPQGEEFPAFVQWWIVRPEREAREIKAWALLDSPCAAGAWQFRIQPGRATVMEVEAEVTFRSQPELVGFAPFSTMMWYSEFTQPKPPDFRPEVHDADGLLLHFSDREAVWRPLDNSKSVRHSVFQADKFLGFGLAQRDREFASYQDLSAHFHKRPSVWMEPVGQWPAGRINLIEVPAEDDATDNVTAFWEPQEKPKPGEPFRLAYRIHWLPEISAPGLSRVLESRRSRVFFKPEEKRSEETLFVIDFAAPANPADETGEPDLQVESGAGATLTDRRLQRNPNTGGWRASLQLRIDDKIDTLELACRLLKNGRPLTERWSIMWKR